MQTKFCKNGDIIQGDLKIATEFNKFFSEIGPKLASEIKPVNSNVNIETFLDHNNANNFFFTLTDPNDILKIIDELMIKTSSGYDNLNSIFIKKH